MASFTFIEAVNTLANAQSLATGDIVEDTNNAKEEALIAANNSVIAAQEALTSQYKAEEWATKGHNNPVEGTIAGGNARFSSYHWAVVASNIAGDPAVDDNIISANYTWSSSRISNELSQKASISHNHNGVYEPAIVKNTAFNKNFTTIGGDNGLLQTVSRGDHTHSTLYEPKRATSGTAYNKNFGITSGTVAEGDHRHDALYMPLATQGTAYNKNFVVDTNSPQANEIPRGNHTHKATAVSYDNTNNKVITSTTAQGALNQLDDRLGSISVAEKCKLSAGMTNASQVVTISGAGVGSKLITAMSVTGDSRNAIYSGGELTINYPVAPSKLVEGWFSASVTISMDANKEYRIGLFVNDVEVNSAFRSQLGSDTQASSGDFQLSLDGYVSGLSNSDGISIYVYNMTDATDITVTSHTISFAGEPEGSLVISGATVLHSDVTGRDAVNQHPTTSIYDLGSGDALDVILDTKADTITSPVNENMLMMDTLGNIADSGISKTTVNNSMQKIATPTLDNVVVMDSQGQAKDSGVTLATKAEVGGSNTQLFKVANAVNNDEAVSKAQMDSLASLYTTTADFSTHTSASNPHGTTYTDVGAAASSHGHAISDVTNLSDSLSSKYAKIPTAVTNNVVVFGSDGELKDSGYEALNPDIFALAADVGTIADFEGAL